MHNASLLGTATVGTKGQIVIPADAREKLNIQPGDKVFIIGAGPNGDMLGLCTEKSMRGLMQHLNDKLSMMQAAIDPEMPHEEKG